jgi:predicted flap endonuclease-1-like 5' DNA nuclease
VGERERTREIASLEAALAELEAALSDNGQWQALVAETDQAGREQRERELSGNPVYRSWRAVNAAIEKLRPLDRDAAPAPTDPPEDSRGPADDLTRIRGVDAKTAGALAALGFTRFDQIAAWRRDDVRAVSQALGLTREVSRQNWIEQAALLERRKVDERHDVERGRQRDIDLKDILDAIRKEASLAGGEPPVVVANEQVPAGLDAPADAAIGEPRAPVQEPTEPQPAVAELDAEPSPQPPAADSDAEAPPSASQTSRIPTVAASAHVNTEAAERAKRLEEERRRLRDAGQAGLQGAVDLDEALVTFVIREPAGRTGVSGASSRDRPSPVASRDWARRRAKRVDGFAPSTDLAEETEVVLVKSGGRHGGDSSTDRLGATGPVLKFLRSFRRS